MLVNYWRDDRRESTLNLVVARVGLATYAIWKLLSYDLTALEGWPAALYDAHSHGALRLPPGSLAGVEIELALAVAALAVFATGHALRLSAFVAALLIAHLTALHYVPSNAGSTFLPAVYFLLLWGLFADEDRPGLRPRTARDGAPVRLSVLRWGQLVFAACYFFTGWAKLTKAGLAWAGPSNLALIIHREAIMHLDGVPWLGRLLIEHPPLAALSTVATLVFECGFLPALLLGAPLWPFALGLLGMHTLIDFTMGIFFFDQYLIFALFIPWDRLQVRRIDARRPVAQDAR